jgi:hypothetical protein
LAQAFMQLSSWHAEMQSRKSVQSRSLRQLFAWAEHSAVRLQFAQVLQSPLMSQLPPPLVVDVVVLVVDELLLLVDALVDELLLLVAVPPPPPPPPAPGSAL